MTCLEFCKMFNVYIGFDQSGYGQIFASKPKLIEKDNFFLSNNDAKLLPCLVEDYNDYSSKRKTVLISPTEDKVISLGKKEKTIMECSDYRKDDVFEGNVTVIEVFRSPDPVNDGEKFIVTSRDANNHDFVWNTKSKNIPGEHETKFLRAKIVKNTASTEFGIPAFEVTNCKFLNAKK